MLMINYRFDDGGRADAGYPVSDTDKDCAVRATSISLAPDPTKWWRGPVYESVRKTYADLYVVRTGEHTADKGAYPDDTEQVLRDFGYCKIPISQEVTFSTAALLTGGTCIVHSKSCRDGFGDHVVAIVGYELRDTWDSRVAPMMIGVNNAVEVLVPRKATTVWALKAPMQN